MPTCKEMEDYMNHGKTVHAQALDKQSKTKVKAKGRDNFCTFVNGKLITGTEGEIEYITRTYYSED